MAAKKTDFTVINRNTLLKNGTNLQTPFSLNNAQVSLFISQLALDKG